MAATPKRAQSAENALTGADWTEKSASAAGARIADDFTPLTDHRATAEYRTRVAANLFTRLYRDLSAAEAELEVVRL